MERKDKIKEVFESTSRQHNNRLILLRELLESKGYEALNNQLQNDFPEDAKDYQFKSYKEASRHLEIMEKLNLGLNVNKILDSLN